MTMRCRIGGPELAPVALALLAQHPGQGKGRGIAGTEWDRQFGRGSHPGWTAATTMREEHHRMPTQLDNALEAIITGLTAGAVKG